MDEKGFKPMRVVLAYRLGAGSGEGFLVLAAVVF